MNPCAPRRVAGSVLLALVCASPLGFAQPQPVGSPARADNTSKNAEPGPTADQQANAKRDVELSAKIRRAVVSDKALSMAAHNIKIITISGVVTLKGPVRSLDEKKAVAEKASQIVGAGNVRDELSVAPKE
jgi:hyperosmotically inducible periplasmic protein